MLQHTEPETTHTPPVVVTPTMQEPLATQETATVPLIQDRAALRTFLRRKVRRQKTRSLRFIAGLAGSVLAVPLFFSMLSGTSSNFAPFILLVFPPLLSSRASRRF